eukprot:scaffold16570_cov64-Phaeocystis_antarctica.AAC.3
MYGRPAAAADRSRQRRACDHHQAGQLYRKRRGKTSGCPLRDDWKSEATTTEMDVLLSLFYRGLWDVVGVNAGVVASRVEKERVAIMWWREAYTSVSRMVPR